MVSGTEAARAQPAQEDPPAHDAFTRLLHRLAPDPATLWAEAAPLGRARAGVLVRDDSTLEQPAARTSGLLTRHCSGQHRRVVPGRTRLTRRWAAGDALLPGDYRRDEQRSRAEQARPCRARLDPPRRAASPRSALSARAGTPVWRTCRPAERTAGAGARSCRPTAWSTPTARQPPAGRRRHRRGRHARPPARRRRHPGGLIVSPRRGQGVLGDARPGPGRADPAAGRRVGLGPRGRPSRPQAALRRRARRGARRAGTAHPPRRRPPRLPPAGAAPHRHRRPLVGGQDQPHPRRDPLSTSPTRATPSPRPQRQLRKSYQYLLDIGFTGWHDLDISLPFAILRNARTTEAMAKLAIACDLDVAGIDAAD